MLQVFKKTLADTNTARWRPGVGHSGYLIVVFVDVLVEFMQGHQVVQLSRVVLKHKVLRLDFSSVGHSSVCSVRLHSLLTAQLKQSSSPGHWLRWSV